MLLLVWILVTEWRLPGDSFPVYARTTPLGLYWVQCDQHGRTQLLYEKAGQFKPVTLPATTVAIAIHPQKNQIAVLTRNQNLAYTLNNEQLGQLLWQQPAQNTLPPWILLPANPEHILVPNGQGWSQLDWVSGKSQFISIEPALSEDGRLFPDPVPTANGWFFQSSSQFYRLRDQAVQVSPLPAKANMEQVFALDETGQNWFFLGGKSGDLDSFGWHLEPQGLHNQKVIVLKWGLDPHQPNRLILFTVTSQIRSQIAASLFGKIGVTGQVLLRGTSGWTALEPFTFDLAKDKPDQPFQTGWSFESDLNTDGLGDLVLSQDGKQLEIFLSRKDGNFAPVQKLDRRNDRLLFLPDKLFLMRQKPGYIAIEELDL